MTYEAWRISYQSSEQAARTAYAECARLQAKIAEMERQKPSIRPAALYPVISWLRNGCDPMKAADELEILTAATEAKPCP